MFDTEARHIVEALRSGVPSRSVGQYFSESRPRIMEDIRGRLAKTAETQRSSGMVIAGKYGEGKTHLLNTVFNLAEEKQMVVSYVSLSKETPINRLPELYRKIVANTYLPGHRQPGFMQELEQLTANSPVGSDLLLYGAKSLATDKLFYVLRSYFGTEDADERFLLQADLEGDFIGSGLLKKIYRRIFSETAKFNVPFSKTKNTDDYFSFLSHMFRVLGYGGWVILVDETELMGRMSKKARMAGYENIAGFLAPGENLQSVFTVFALSASYCEDVIESRHEAENLLELPEESQKKARLTMEAFSQAPQLLPLTKQELLQVFARIIELHGQAYDWQPQVTAETIEKNSGSGSYLLRTRIRSAIEYLDQLYQYGEAGSVQSIAVMRENLQEDPQESSVSLREVERELSAETDEGVDDKGNVQEK